MERELHFHFLLGSDSMNEGDRVVRRRDGWGAALGWGDQWKLIWRAKRGDREALEALYESIHPMVVRIAKRMRGPALDHDDLIQEGYLYFLEAVRLARRKPGVKFSSFAYLVIRRKMLTAMTSCKNVNVGVSHMPAMEMTRLRYQISSCGSRILDGASVGSLRGTPDQREYAFKAEQKRVQVLDVLQEKERKQRRKLDLRWLRYQIAALKKADSLAARVLRMRMQGMSCHAIGLELGRCHETVRQLEMAAYAWIGARGVRRERVMVPLQDLVYRKVQRTAPKRKLKRKPVRRTK